MGDTATYTFYCHTCLANGKPYVGQTLNTMEKRWREHVSAAKYQNSDEVRLLSFAIRKYGRDAFEHEVLEVVVTTQEDADRRETEWIQKRNSLSPNGYNLLTGGKSNGRHHEDTKRQMSEDQKKRMAKMPPEKRTEFFKRTIHRPENWTPERRAKHGAILQSDKSRENRRKAAPRQAEKVRQFQFARQASLTPEQRRAPADEAWRTRRTRYGQKGIKNPKAFEDASATSRGNWAKISPERRSEIARGRWAKISPEERSRIASKQYAGMTTQERAERGRKISEGRRRAKEAKAASVLTKLDADLVPFVRHWLSRGHSAEEVAQAFETSVSEVKRLVA